MNEGNTIDVRINGNEQLFSSFSYNDDKLSPELSDFILTKARQADPLPHNENFVIQIHTEVLNLPTAEIARCLHRHFHDAYDAAKREFRKLIGFIIMMLSFGMTSLLLYFFAYCFFDNFFLNEIFEIAAWVFMWEMVDALFLKRHDLYQDRRILRRLAYADVVLCESIEENAMAPEYIR